MQVPSFVAAADSGRFVDLDFPVARLVERSALRVVVFFVGRN
jgi:hypothetical protein